MTQTTLSVSKVSLHYTNAAESVLNNTSLKLNKGEIACLLGASGCGKTSLLRCIAGFEKPLQGEIYLEQTLASSPDFFLAVEQRQIGMVFQDYALFPHLSVKKNIQFGLKNSSIPAALHLSVVDDTIALLGLSEQADKFPHQISGGQQQRVAIGRAIATKPKLLLLDEPFSNLDLHLRERLAHDLRQLLKSQDITALMVTHDQQEAFAFADTIGVMNAGKIEQWGCANEIYHQPKTNYVANFIGDGVVVNEHQAKALGCHANDFGIYIIRPEHLELDSNGEFIAHVKSIHPQGHSLLLRCEVAFETQPSIEILIRCNSNIQVKDHSTIQFSLKS